MITRYCKKLSVFLLLATFLLPATVNAADEKADPTVVRDAHYGEDLFYFYQEDYFPAIVRLLAAQKQTQLGNHADGIWSDFDEIC